MNKKLFKAYVRTLVEDEVQRVLPELLAEAISEIKSLNENVAPATAPAPNRAPGREISRGELARLMGLEYNGETLAATSTDNIGMGTAVSPSNAPAPVANALNRDYSEFLKRVDQFSKR